jgi:hypothetical protein
MRRAEGAALVGPERVKNAAGSQTTAQGRSTPCRQDKEKTTTEAESGENEVGETGSGGGEGDTGGDISGSLSGGEASQSEGDGEHEEDSDSATAEERIVPTKRRRSVKRGRPACGAAAQQQRRKTTPWSQKELDAVQAGVEALKEGKWKQILVLHHEVFAPNERTATDIKDAWNRIKRKRQRPE